MWRKWSWLVFVLIGGIGVAMSIQTLIAPQTFVDMMADVGPAKAADFVRPDTAPFLDFLTRWMATSLIGVNGITVVVACTALRRRERWAAYAMLYWPAMFTSHFLMYETGPMTVVQIVWFVLSLAAIASVLLPSSSRVMAPAHA